MVVFFFLFNFSSNSCTSSFPYDQVMAAVNGVAWEGY